MSALLMRSDVRSWRSSGVSLHAWFPRVQVQWLGFGEFDANGVPGVGTIAEAGAVAEPRESPSMHSRDMSRAPSSPALCFRQGSGT